MNTIWSFFDAAPYLNKYVSFQNSTQLNYDLHIDLYPSIFCPFHASYLGTLILYKKRHLLKVTSMSPFKVQILWEGRKVWKHLPTFFKLRSMYVNM